MFLKSYFATSGPARCKEILAYGENSLILKMPFGKKKEEETIGDKCLMKTTFGNGVSKPPLEDSPEATRVHTGSAA